MCLFTRAVCLPTMPWGRQTPLSQKADPTPPQIQSSCGRYASYWNAYLFKLKLYVNEHDVLYCIYFRPQGKVLFSQMFAHKRPHGYWFTAHPCTHPTGMLSCFTKKTQNFYKETDAKTTGNVK